MHTYGIAPNLCNTKLYKARFRITADCSWFSSWWKEGIKAICRKVHICFSLGIFKMHAFFNALVGWHRGKCHSRVIFDKWSPADGEESIKGGVFERSALVSIGIVWTRQYPCQNPVQQKHTGVKPHLPSPAAARRGVSASPHNSPNPPDMRL